LGWSSHHRVVDWIALLATSLHLYTLSPGTSHLPFPEKSSPIQEEHGKTLRHRQLAQTGMTKGEMGNDSSIWEMCRIITALGGAEDPNARRFDSEYSPNNNAATR
jgi:hypothetical protein